MNYDEMKEAVDRYFSDTSRPASETREGFACPVCCAASHAPESAPVAPKDCRKLVDAANAQREVDRRSAAIPPGTGSRAMSELLPCPLCGNPDVDDDEGCFHFPARNHVLECWAIQCGTPGCVGIEAPTREECVRKWNTRSAIPASTQAPVEGYYLATFKHGGRGYMLWWGPDNRGYTPDLEQAGIYTSITPGYHDNEETVPVPVALVNGLRLRRMLDVGDTDNDTFLTAKALRAALLEHRATALAGLPR